MIMLTTGSFTALPNPQEAGRDRTRSAAAGMLLIHVIEHPPTISALSGALERLTKRKVVPHKAEGGFHNAAKRRNRIAITGFKLYHMDGQRSEAYALLGSYIRHWRFDVQIRGSERSSDARVGRTGGRPVGQH
jgi:hypothetical protein